MFCKTAPFAFSSTAGAFFVLFSQVPHDSGQLPSSSWMAWGEKPMIHISPQLLPRNSPQPWPYGLEYVSLFRHAPAGGGRADGLSVGGGAALGTGEGATVGDATGRDARAAAAPAPGQTAHDAGHRATSVAISAGPNPMIHISPHSFPAKDPHAWAYRLR